MPEPPPGYKESDGKLYNLEVLKTHSNLSRDDVVRGVLQAQVNKGVGRIDDLDKAKKVYDEAHHAFYVAMERAGKIEEN